MSEVEKSEKAAEASAPSTEEKEKQAPRKIGGNIPYVSSPGVFKKALDGIITAEKPESFNINFLETILKLSGGSARAVPPQLKKMGFLSADGTPTERYSQFRTDSGRSGAALQGLKDAFNDIFKRNSYAHGEDENGLKDIFVQVTGLKKNDRIIGLMYQTFDAIRGYVNKGEVEDARPPAVVSPPAIVPDKEEPRDFYRSVGLAYNINIVTPETSDPAVLNAIFKAVKDNLL